MGGRGAEAGAGSPGRLETQRGVGGGLKHGGGGSRWVWVEMFALHCVVASADSGGPGDRQSAPARGGFAPSPSEDPKTLFLFHK